MPVLVVVTSAKIIAHFVGVMLSDLVPVDVSKISPMKVVGDWSVV